MVVTAPVHRVHGPGFEVSLDPCTISHSVTCALQMAVSMHTIHYLGRTWGCMVDTHALLLSLPIKLAMTICYTILASKTI